MIEALCEHFQRDHFINALNKRFVLLSRAPCKPPFQIKVNIFLLVFLAKLFLIPIRTQKIFLLYS